MKKRIWLLVAAVLGGAMVAHAETDMLEEKLGDEVGQIYAGTSMESAEELRAIRARIAELREEHAREAAAAREAATKREKKGLVLHYSFGKGGEWEPGSVVKDLSGGGHDGVVEGDGLEVVRGMGKRGKAVRFDGKGDYIRVPRDAALEPDEITVAVWVRIREGDIPDGCATIVFKRNTLFNDNEDYRLSVYPNRVVRADVSDPCGGHNRIDSSVAIAPDLWHHLAMAFRGGETRLYVDGVLVGTGTFPPALDHNRNADLLIGGRDHATYPMECSGAFDLAEVKIWPEALETEQVAALYRERSGLSGVTKPENNGKAMGEQSTAGMPPPRDNLPKRTGLVLRYAFGKGGEWGPGSVVENLSGEGHDGTVGGDGLEVVRGIGKRGKAVRFDGKGDYIRVARDEALEGEEITVAAWVRVREDANWEDGATIAFKRNASFNHNEGYCLEIFPDRTVRATVSGPNAAQCRVQSTVPIEDGVWHHLAMSHAPGDTRLYINGVLVGRGNHPKMVVHNQEADLLIGGRDHAAYPTGRFGVFDLAEVKVWNGALGEGKMAELYAERAGCPGVGKQGKAGTARVEFEGVRTGDGRPPIRKFPAWEPGKSGGEAELEEELRTLVAQGRRDRAASPEFLEALEALLERHVSGEEKPSDQLPLKPEFRGPGMPAGWSAVKPEVWRFGNGEARQMESRANTRYVLFYEPGKAWRDYEVRVRFESDQWFAPPANSGAELYFRYKGVDDAYRVDWNGNGYLQVISCETGGERIMVRVPVGPEVIRDGKPWSLRLRGEEIAVDHEGKRVLELRDGTHREGTVGLESIHIPMRFGGVEVK